MAKASVLIVLHWCRLESRSNFYLSLISRCFTLTIFGLKVRLFLIIKQLKIPVLVDISKTLVHAVIPHVNVKSFTLEGWFTKRDILPDAYLSISILLLVLQVTYRVIYGEMLRWNVNDQLSESFLLSSKMCRLQLILMWRRNLKSYHSTIDVHLFCKLIEL